ncbi:MAG: CRISPR-associated endonuclease Cas2 [Candidatus Lokiarchaeota archaeon]|nr:CRISPR-associated endonuclease Cas2 [Candidatus Lokiarchaeota archaeon]
MLIEVVDLIYIVVYDITNDNLRNKISECLKNYGLERIQYSGFFGDLTKFGLKSLQVDLKKLMNDRDETDSVIIIPVCNSCFKNKVVIGKAWVVEEKEFEVSVF